METATPLSIEEVWEIFLRQRDPNARNFLLLHYLRSVKNTAERLHSVLPSRIDRDDLISAGIYGLMKAIDSFDPSQNVEFKTYSMYRIRGAMRTGSMMLIVKAFLTLRKTIQEESLPWSIA